jgi:hypothetical protein
MKEVAAAIVIGAALISGTLHLTSPRYQMELWSQGSTATVRLDTRTGEVEICNYREGCR